MPEDELIANTRKGKQVMNLSGDEEAALIVPAEGDTIVVIGQNRKMVDFPRRRIAGDDSRQEACGCRNTRMAGISDARMFNKADGMSWTDSSGPNLRQDDGRVARLGRRAGASRPPAASGLSAEQQIR